jgi:2-polyprenyl-6-methoxyphenol hydroxylase-like FAD-dependent oxidoreductase
MAKQDRPLIVGAGPTGKGAALFLARAGIATRVIDVATEPARQSKALAVNPRSLELLEPTGVTEQMLSIGLPMRRARLHNGPQIVDITFDELPSKYKFMLALSQAVTERLLGEAFEKLGGSVERGIGLVSCRNANDGVTTELKHQATGTTETVECPWLLAADGAHSTTRHALNVAFRGSTFQLPWYLADLPLKTRLQQDVAHAFFVEGGFVFVIRVVDDESPANAERPIWRVISNRPNPIDRLLEAEPAGAPVWESSFRIAHRINEHLQVGNIYFAGDAAHIHSPIGARGMNLGLEDAWVFAQLASRGELARYESLRKPVDARIVKRIEMISRMVVADSSIVRFVRSLFARWGLKVPAARRLFITTASGLDHRVST